jgi:hypothetical protein
MNEFVTRHIGFASFLRYVCGEETHITWEAGR